MNSSKHLNTVALFPLCDAHGDLIDILRNTSDPQGTRADSLVFAWRLGLPEGMDVGQAAEAVLVVALSVPRKAWSARQLLIVRELMLLAESKSSVAWADNNSERAKLSMRRADDETVGGESIVRESGDSVKLTQNTTNRLPPKKSKNWWKLVGRQPSDSIPKQRKTRRIWDFQEP